MGDCAEPRFDERKFTEALADEIARRSMRCTTIDAIDYKPSSPIPDSQLAPTGTIAVYVSRKGSKLLDDIRDAARSPRGNSDRKLARRVIRTFRQKSPMSMDEAARLILTQPVIARLNYGGATMAQTLYAEADDDLHVTLLPYAGGPLLEQGFRFDEFLHEDDDEPLECVLIKNPPVLTTAEDVAIKRLPPDLAHAYVSPLDMHASTLLPAVALHVIVWGAVAGTFTLVKAHWDNSMEHINPQAVDALGPMATVRALLKMRIDILKGQKSGPSAQF
jgi:hypothetical protein